MRRLLRERFVHNRDRMVAAAFFTAHLCVAWRERAARFVQRLVDGVVAITRATGGGSPAPAPTRVRTGVCAPERQTRPFDSDGAYAGGHVPEFSTPDNQLPLA
jgi:deoxyribodipyrimidine photo-lyase